MYEKRRKKTLSLLFCFVLSLNTTELCHFFPLLCLCKSASKIDVEHLTANERGAAAKKCMVATYVLESREALQT